MVAANLDDLPSFLTKALPYVYEYGPKIASTLLQKIGLKSPDDTNEERKEI